MKLFRLFPLVLILVAGCSVFPGLRVLTGEDAATMTTQQSAGMLELVMADKTGMTDPSLIAAADRIEAALMNVDIIEIRKDDANDVFVVNMLFVPPASQGDTQLDLFNRYTAIQRTMELTWQGTLAESEGVSQLQVNFIDPMGVSTLDGGPSYIGFYYVIARIDRTKAITYLSGPRDLNAFMNMIIDGTLSYENPQDVTVYGGVPNHPLFMLDTASVPTS